MLTADLTGAKLALWVGRIEHLEDVELCGAEIGCRTPRCEYVKHEQPGDDGWWTEFSPHTDWSQGGRLIEKHRIELFANAKTWTAGIMHRRCHMAGPTPLIAAMRALVASVYGDSVPDEITP